MKKITITLLILFSFNSYAGALKSRPKKKLEKVKDVNPKEIFKSFYLNKTLTRLYKEQPSFSKTALIKALVFFDKNKDGFQSNDSICLKKDNKNNRQKIRNLNCMVVADYSKSKKDPRLLYINPQSGESELFYTAHGKGSHKKTEIETGHLAERFSNVEGSNMTSLGFYLTDFLYTSKKTTFGPGPSNGLKLDGINCTNNNARQRYIVMHTADYVPSLSKGSSKIGNSEGCVTFPEARKDILKKCQGGALVYAYYKR